jgi:hypothetical protein
MTENKVFSIWHTLYYYGIHVTCACEPGKEKLYGQLYWRRQCLAPHGDGESGPSVNQLQTLRRLLRWTMSSTSVNILIQVANDSSRQGQLVVPCDLAKLNNDHLGRRHLVELTRR